MKQSPKQFPLGARLDYVVKVVSRQAEGLADGADLVIDMAGVPLTIVREGDRFHLTGGGEPDRTLGADDLASAILRAALTHTTLQVRAGQVVTGEASKAA